MMKIQTLIFILIFTPAFFAQDFSVTVFPEKKDYEKYYADAISHQLSLNKHLESNQWYGNIGAALPVFDVHLGNFKTQISAGATVFNTLIKTPGHIQVFTVDYLVDFYGDIELYDGFYSRFIWGHLSAHFSDDGITQLEYFPVSYVRDYMGLHFQKQFKSFDAKIYLGGFWNFHNEPREDRHFTYQVGGDYSYKATDEVAFYGAVDIKIKAEVEYGSTQTYQVGIIFPYHKSNQFRIAFNHRTGFEERGQLYNIKEDKNFLGFYIDF